MYAQDTWRIRPDFTITFGLRYSLDRPIYEANGLEVKPTPASPRFSIGSQSPRPRASRTTTLFRLTNPGP